MNRYIKKSSYNGVLKTEPSLFPPEYPDDDVEIGDRVKVGLFGKDQWYTVDDISTMGGSTIYSISNDRHSASVDFDLIKEIQGYDHLDYDADTPDEYW